MLIYCVHNTVNGKSYVGQTRQPLQRRWKAHLNEAFNQNSSRFFCRAIRKYGKEAFEVFPLAEAQTQEQLNALERLWIAVLGTAARIKGYNRTHGAEAGMNEAARKQMAETKRGGRLSQEHKDKIAAGVTGTCWTPEARARWKGHKKTEETKKLMAAAQRGHHRCGWKASEESIENYRQVALKRTYSPETRAKMSASAKSRCAKRGTQNGANS